MFNLLLIISEIDSITLGNWIAAAIIGFIFASLGAWLTAYLNHKYYLKQYIAETHAKSTREVLGQIWEQSQDALGRIYAFYAGYRKSPDLNIMTEEQLTQFLKATQLNAYQKEKIMEASHKNKYYSEIITINDKEIANKAINEFHNELRYKKIFIPDDLYDELIALGTLLSKSFGSYEIGREVHDVEIIQEGKQFIDMAVEKNKEIEKKIKEELSSS